LIVWFAAPWLFCAAKLVRTMVYESRHGYRFADTWNVPGIFRQIEEIRKKDPIYDRMRGDLHRWFMITGIWWFGSFFALVAFAFVFAVLSR
jgi:hypothetical protein